MNLRLALVAASLAMSGCAHVQPPPVSSEISGRIAQCGASIAIRRAIELKLVKRSDQTSVSAELKEEIRATIFDKIEAVDQPYVFSRYIDCVTAQHDINAIISDIPQKKALLIYALSNESYKADEIARIASYFDIEENELKGLKILKARETHRQMVMSLVNLIIAHSGNIEPYAPILSVGTPHAKPTYLATAVFAELCKSVSGDDPICQSETMKIKNAQKPCELLNSLVDRALCEIQGPANVWPH